MHNWIRFFSLVVFFSSILSYSHADQSVSCTDSLNKIIQQALSQIEVTRYYDPSYLKIKYPGGDVSVERGVCTDVIVRAFRSVGIDLQVLIHEDMKAHFEKYPKKWGLKNPDSNIDHRRVPNIVTWLKRNGKWIADSGNSTDFRPGDIVTWDLGNHIDHIGIVSNKRVENSDRYAIIHNIGNGAVLEDMLFNFKITGHFRYFCL